MICLNRIKAFYQKGGRKQYVNLNKKQTYIFEIMRPSILFSHGNGFITVLNLTYSFAASLSLLTFSFMWRTWRLVSDQAWHSRMKGCKPYCSISLRRLETGYKLFQNYNRKA